MNKLIMTWDEEISEEMHYEKDMHYTEEGFNKISAFIQQKLTEKGRLILNPVDLNGIEDFDELYKRVPALEHCSKGYIGTIVDTLREYTRMITSPPEPKERKLWVHWDTDEYIAISEERYIGYEFHYYVPESIIPEIGYTASEWNAARESGKLDAFEVKGGGV